MFSQFDKSNLESPVVAKRVGIRFAHQNVKVEELFGFIARGGSKSCAKFC